ncbi:MAG: CRISPR-associated helicase Cas3', partial [Chitinivibrionales bacterium]|nr:CRISPR-associated helicase Cas3' [Chitinivibrionales bacterium]
MIGWGYGHGFGDHCERVQMNERSDSYYGYWGKAVEREDGTQACHLLAYHCLDVAAVTQQLLKTLPVLRGTIRSVSGLGDDVLSPLLVTFAALHDVGKFAAAFQQRVPALAERLQPGSSTMVEGHHHTELGFALWHAHLAQTFSRATLPDDCLASRQTRDTLNLLASLAVCHHGKPSRPERFAINTRFAPRDIAAAECFCETVAQMMLPRRLDSGEIDKSERHAAAKRASWLIAGVIVLADWIASGIEPERMCEQRLDLAAYWAQRARPFAKDAVTRAGLAPVPSSTEGSTRELFPSIQEPTPLQKLCEQIAVDSKQALYIVEDLTGAGKTEAALTLAKRKLLAGENTGIFVALPTMATADAMYNRVSSFFGHLFVDSTKASLVLAHSARDYSDRFRASVVRSDARGQDGATGTRDGDEGSAQCEAWLADNRKKALLAHVGVGTIDQLVLGALPVRHQVLRLLGLVGKVLIVDEIHSYDQYMNGLLEALLRFHFAFGGSAILLSATLPQRLRQRFVGLFGDCVGPVEGSPESRHYPLLTGCALGKLRMHELESRKLLERHVDTELVDTVEGVLQRIAEWHAQGRCCCWIRNTVADAIEAYNELTKR